jgi:hypothetical protein
MFGLGLGATLRIGAALAVLAGLAWSHVEAYRMGVAAERSAALQRSVDLLRERNATDDQVRNMDDAALCAALGGRVSDNGTCE